MYSNFAYSNGENTWENSMSKLDNDAKRVANIYIELPMRHVLCGCI